MHNKYDNTIIMFTDAEIVSVTVARGEITVEGSKTPLLVDSGAKPSMLVGKYSPVQHITCSQVHWTQTAFSLPQTYLIIPNCDDERQENDDCTRVPSMCTPQIGNVNSS